VLVGAAAAGVAAIAYNASRPDSLPDRLSNWVGDPSCLGGKAQVKRGDVEDLKYGAPEFVRFADSLTIVTCEDLGPVTWVVRFRSRAELLHAFLLVPRRAPPHRESVARDNWCLVGRSAFSGNTLDHKGDLPRFCCRVQGSIQRETDRPLPTLVRPNKPPEGPPWIRYRARGVPQAERRIPDACRVVT
jgi:hypothetical protein